MVAPTRENSTSSSEGSFPNVIDPTLTDTFNHHPQPSGSWWIRSMSGDPATTVVPSGPLRVNDALNLDADLPDLTSRSVSSSSDDDDDDDDEQQQEGSRIISMRSDDRHRSTPMLARILTAIRVVPTMPLPVEISLDGDSQTNELLHRMQLLGFDGEEQKSNVGEEEEKQQ